MCRYYLPPCGNFELTHTLPPSSICQEECSQVQSECHETWQTAAVLLTPYPFINCDDTSRLLFPLPNCCTGAGITSGTGEEASGSVVPTPTLIVDVGMLNLIILPQTIIIIFSSRFWSSAFWCKWRDCSWGGDKYSGSFCAGGYCCSGIVGDIS